MGNQYYGVCISCTEYIRLNKFYDWNPTTKSSTEIQDYCNEDWVKASIRLHEFLGMHLGHQIWIGHENDTFIDKMYEEELTFYQKFKLIKMN